MSGKLKKMFVVTQNDCYSRMFTPPKMAGTRREKGRQAPKTVDALPLPESASI